MMYQKSYNNKGMILADILLALSLAAVFVAICVESNLTASSLFAWASEREQALEAYQDTAFYFEDMMPYEERSLEIEGEVDEGMEITAKAQWFGNDRIETVITAGPITLNAVRSFPFAELQESAGTPLCSFDFTGKRWSRAGAISIKPVMLPIDPLLPLTDVEVRNGTAYVTADSTVVGDPDVLIVEIQDTAAPELISSLNTGPGISALSLVGSWIYAAAASTAAQLHVIDIDPLHSPSVTKKYQLPPPFATATPAIGTAAFYRDQYLYIGTEKGDGEEFSVIEMNDPHNPVKIGGFETNSKVTDIFVRNTTAYVSASAQTQLYTLDVSDPLDIQISDEFSPSGWLRQEGKRISYFEDTLSLGRTAGGFDIATDHELFTGTSSSTPLELIASRNIPGGIYGIVSDRFHMFVVTRDPGRELQIFDQALATTSAMTYSLPVAPQALTCDNGNLYVLAHSAPVIYEITFN